MSPSVHHIAIGARDVARVAEFYRETFRLTEVDRHHNADGGLRSIWLEAGAVVVMVEHTRLGRPVVEGVDAGPFLVAFAASPDDRQVIEATLAAAGCPAESRTDFTTYFRDPEGNRVAVSSYPHR